MIWHSGQIKKIINFRPMTTRALKLIPVLSISLLCIISSCKKEVVQGPAGETGAAGKNATVTTTTFTVSSAAWGMDPDSLIWSTVVFTPLITKEIVEKGIVKMSVLRGSSWWELPLTENRDILTQFGFEQGQVQFEVVELHGRAPRPADQKFKMDIIPPQ